MTVTVIEGAHVVTVDGAGNRVSRRPSGAGRQPHRRRGGRPGAFRAGGRPPGGPRGCLVTTGCSTTTDHHYVFPADGGDVLGAEIEAARAVGVRCHPTRGSMDLRRSSGGRPPDHVVEDLDVILSATEAAIDTQVLGAPPPSSCSWSTAFRWWNRAGSSRSTTTAWRRRYAARADGCWPGRVAEG